MGAITKQSFGTLEVQTPGRGLVDVTGQVSSWLATTDVRDGLLTLFLRHTSASLLIQENADPDVLRDLDRFFARLVPDGDPMFHHVEEGIDDMPAHVRAALTQVHLAIPVAGHRMQLGTWQGIYVYEHRHAHHVRQLALHVLGE